MIVDRVVWFRVPGCRAAGGTGPAARDFDLGGRVSTAQVVSTYGGAGGHRTDGAEWSRSGEWTRPRSIPARPPLRSAAGPPRPAERRDTRRALRRGVVYRVQHGS